jgi:hypothetical protein
MPTVSELITQVADETGLDATADQATILRSLNRSYRRICQEAACLQGTPGSLAGDGSSVDISLSTLSNLLSVDAVYLLSGGVYTPLPRVTADTIMQARTSPEASMYAYDGGSLLVDGPVATTDSLYVRWTAAPSALTAVTTEAGILGVNFSFHEDLLAGLAMTHILEGEEGEEERAAYYRGLAMEAMVRFKRHLVDRGGDEMPNSRYGAAHFHTPPPLGSR